MFDHLIQQLYEQGLNRAPDAEGYKYWQDNIGQFQGNNTQFLTPEAIAAFHGGSKYGQQGDFEAMSKYRPWGDYNAQANQQVANLNAMPGVYNYGQPEYYTDDEVKGIMSGLKKRIGGLGGLGGVE